MNVVVDTNVIVSGLLSPFSPCGEIVRMVSSGDLTLCFDARLLVEYGEVLRRPRFGLAPGLVATFLDQVAHAGTAVSGVPLAAALPDPDDAAFLEVALAGHAACLVTGHPKHFPVGARQGVPLLSPRDFIDHYRAQTTKPNKRRSKTGS